MLVKARPGPKPAFTREDILRRALAILARQGHRALSFRTLAAALKTSHQALYNYFENLADLEDEIAAKLISQVRPLDASSPSPLREQLVRYGLDLVDKFRLYPYLREITGPISADVAGRLHNQNLRALTGAGIDLRRAHAGQTIIQLVASGLAELHGRRIALKLSSSKVRSAYVRQVRKGLPDAQQAVIDAALESPPDDRALLDTIIDAHLPELRRP